MKDKFKTVLIEMRCSNIDGVGVFGVKRINKGKVIAEGIHEDDYRDLVSWDELASCDEDVKKKVHDFCIGNEKGFLPPENYDFSKLSVEWYMNHSCNGNVGFDDNGDFVSLRDIEKDEELTYDYGLAESNPDFKMKCNCRKSTCRKVISGNDWKEPNFRKRNFNHMLPRLRVLSR
jgi:uncharacterized protein